MAQLGTTNINGDCNITGNLTITTGGGKINPLVDLIYPVGSYFFSNSTNFATVEQVEKHFGGTWTKLGDGFFIEAGSTITTRAPGLPNITGQIGNALSDQAIGRASGAFTTWASAAGFQGSDKYKWTSFDFDANRGASVQGIYGNSSTVQPKSRTAYIYYRTA